MFEKTYLMENTRTAPRLRAYYLIKFQPLNEAGEPSVSNLKEISTAGLSFWTAKQLKEGSLLRLSVCIPPLERKFETVAQVLRVHRGQEIYWVAVRFLKFLEEERVILGSFIQGLYRPPDSRPITDGSQLVKRRVPLAA